MQESIDYIKDFLVSDDDTVGQMVGYCRLDEDWTGYKVVIISSGFFSSAGYGSPSSLPTLPLQQVEGIPLLYGHPKIEEQNGVIICHADLIASTYFMISRYEELFLLDSQRDSHGRLIGSKSFAAKAGFLMRPIVDEYRDLLRSLLARTGVRLTPIPGSISQINLTHDIDSISHYRRWRGFCGGIKRALIDHDDKILRILQSIQNIELDPAFTFRFIASVDNRLPSANKIYFVKAAHNPEGYDYPGYNLHGKDFRHTVDVITSCSPDARFALHASYASGDNPDLIASEQRRLEEALQETLYFNRHHFLRATRPSDMEYLVDCDITDDFTMGFADQIGFRLGTCRSVQWINPETRRLTDLHLHPLTIMDCTLSNNNYMNLTFEKAIDKAKEIINIIKKHNGEVTLLWHNTIFNAKNSYHRRLYSDIIDWLAESN